MSHLRCAGIYVLLAGPMLHSGPSWADSWQNAFSVRLSAEHDSNPTMSPSYPGGVWRALFEPNYTLVGRTGETDVKAGLGLQAVRSSDRVLDPNRDSPTAFLDWLHASEGGQLGVSAKYAETATRETGIDSTGQVSASSTRASRSLSGLWSNRMTERRTLAADGALEKVTYKGGNFVDYSSQTGGIKLSYEWSEVTTPFCRVSGIRYLPANDAPYSNLADGALGVEWKTEYMDSTLQGGAAKVGGFKRILEGSAATRYTGERTQWSLSAGRQVLPSGLGGFVRADQALASWRYALTEVYNAGIDIEAHKNFPITINTDETRSATSGAWMDHALTPSWKMRMYYRRWVNQVNSDPRVASNIFGLSIAYSSPTLQP